jgi:alpha-galactosidase
VQGTAYELARDLDIPVEEIRYRAGGINHMAFYLNFEHRQADGSYKNLYPDLIRGYREGRFPKPSHWNPRCPNKVRYEMLTRLGHFVTESSEHFAEYTPWFIKRDRPDLIEKFGIPLDEYPVRCVEQIARLGRPGPRLQAEAERNRGRRNPRNMRLDDHELGRHRRRRAVIYGNIPNRGYIPQLPPGAARSRCRPWSMPTALQPTCVNDIPPQLIALMRTNVNVQDLTVQALMTENREHIYHAAMLDPHTAAELDLRQIRALVDDLIAAHGDWLPGWITGKRAA